MPEHLHPDTDPFEVKLRSLPAVGAEAERQALVDIADTIDFAKRILLQHKVKAFTAADVVRVAELVMKRRDMILAGQSQGVGDDDIF
jgi:hypothetical protein